MDTRVPLGSCSGGVRVFGKMLRATSSNVKSRGTRVRDFRVPRRTSRSYRSLQTVHDKFRASTACSLFAHVARFHGKSAPVRRYARTATKVHAAAGDFGNQVRQIYTSEGDKGSSPTPLEAILARAQQRQLTEELNGTEDEKVESHPLGKLANVLTSAFPLWVRRLPTLDSLRLSLQHVV